MVMSAPLTVDSKILENTKLPNDNILSTDFSSSQKGRITAASSASASPVRHHALQLAGVGGPRDLRRGSFIYKLDLKPDNYSSKSSFSRTFSTSSTDNVHKISEDRNVVTPFAKILTNLHSVRINLARILNISGLECNTKEQKVVEFTEKDRLNEIYEIAADTIRDYDKCLEEVEAIPIQHSLSNMTKLKFKKLLDQELNHLSESKSGNQVSRYIADTFTENEYNAEESADTMPERATATSSSSPDVVHVGVGAGVGDAGSASPSPRVKATNGRLGSSLVGGLFGSRSSKKTTLSASLSSKLCKMYAIKKPHPLRVKLPQSLKKASLPSAGERSTSVERSPTVDFFFGVHTEKRREMVECMHDLDTWGLDVFTLNSLTKGRPLTAVLYTLLKQRNLMRHFQIDEQKLLKYCSYLERNYNNTNPYHNVTHAADVTQSMHFLLLTNCLQDVFNELEIFAALYASAIHDVNHPGVTNQFLVNTASDLAIMYNDESVLEHHHLAIAFKLLQQQNCNFLAELTKKQFATFRRCVIDMVLATDMAKHMNLLAYLKTIVETKNVTSEGLLPFDLPKEKIELLKCMIHLSDLSNPTKPLNLYRQWTEKISEEFWKQGDQERRLGVEISPLCDRKNASLEKSQVGFIDFVVLPLWECWAEFVYPGAQPILENLEHNRCWYFERIPVEEELTEDVELSDRKSNTPTDPTFSSTKSSGHNS